LAGEKSMMMISSSEPCASTPEVSAAIRQNSAASADRIRRFFDMVTSSTQLMGELHLSAAHISS
jgi:hypothetical protein